MVTSTDFQVFEKYKDFRDHAFSKRAGREGIAVTEEDKSTYQRIFDALRDAAANAISLQPRPDFFHVASANFHRDGGIQGQRPLDLWASVVNVESDVLAGYPQVYAIATERGVEVGFSVAIHETDYFNPAAKRRNRRKVPILYGKLPVPDAPPIKDLASILASEGNWEFGLTTRKGVLKGFQSLPELIEFLKSPESSDRGGGAIYRLITPQEFSRPDFDLSATLAHAVSLFTPLMRTLTPNGVEQIRLADQDVVDDAAEEIPDFDPASLPDGRKKTLRAVAVRQGQAKFREKLLEAYGSRCAITGISVTATLQAAHILPYCDHGEDANHVQNGVLLRADIHNLFDLGLIQINPESLRVELARELKKSGFAKLEGRILRLPADKKKRPSKTALEKRFELFSNTAPKAEIKL